MVKYRLVRGWQLKHYISSTTGQQQLRSICLMISNLPATAWNLRKWIALTRLSALKRAKISRKELNKHAELSVQHIRQTGMFSIWYRHIYVANYPDPSTVSLRLKHTQQAMSQKHS